MVRAWKFVCRTETLLFAGEFLCLAVYLDTNLPLEAVMMGFACATLRPRPWVCSASCAYMPHPFIGIPRTEGLCG